MHTLRRLALGCASALALASAGLHAARAGDITYPSLTGAASVQDTDLLATWRASGPLTKVQASVLEAYIQGKLSPLFLQPVNNLSDLANAGTARMNLGLGSAALATTGTSGTALCQLNANCTWSGTENFQAKVTHGASTAAGAMFNLTPGAAPTSPVAGDLWDASTGLFVYLNGATQQVAFTSSNVAGNAATATQWQTARTESLTGDVTGSATGINGAGNWSISTALANSGVGAGTYGNGNGQQYPVFSVDSKGRVTGAYTQSINYPSQLPSQSGNGGADLTTDGGNAKWSIRARVYFNGTNGGLNLWGATNATVTRISTGCYHIDFTNLMPTSNYTFIGTAGIPGGSPLSATQNLAVVESQSFWSRTTSSVGFCVVNSSSNPIENDTVVNVLVEAN